MMSLVCQILQDGAGIRTMTQECHYHGDITTILVGFLARGPYIPRWTRLEAQAIEVRLIKL